MFVCHCRNTVRFGEKTEHLFKTTRDEKSIKLKMENLFLMMIKAEETARHIFLVTEIEYHVQFVQENWDHCLNDSVSC